MSEHAATPPPGKPVDYDELFPGRFLKAGLLKGKPVTLTIADVDVEPLPQDDGKERKRGILSFARTDMQLVLNSTNGQCIRAMFGKAVRDWIGKRITLIPAKDRFGKDVVDCIRISGSPDLQAPIQATIALPRKKPKTVTLTVTGAASAAKQDVAPQTGQSDDAFMRGLEEGAEP